MAKRKKDPRVVNVEAKDAAGYRWLKSYAAQGGAGATFLPSGSASAAGMFLVTDESKWAQALSAAGAREIR